ncbi:MAG: hypothetical protein OXT65_04520 [Alphaproteobacteria bacterium]|nr:hypothetical protein [Alphaproteobacteria bacterium]
MSSRKPKKSRIRKAFVAAVAALSFVTGGALSTTFNDESHTDNTPIAPSYEYADPGYNTLSLDNQTDDLWLMPAEDTLSPLAPLPDYGFYEYTPYESEALDDFWISVGPQDNGDIETFIMTELPPYLGAEVENDALLDVDRALLQESKRTTPPPMSGP